ncbi:hypothetical protein ACIG47_10610 [Promicromonospora sp. NPDC052451]|uniref:hypothetical protein n=1 Tax=unclassified Promicromonospora TaxID=2647929 RepID=UPI0037C7EDEC
MTAYAPVARATVPPSVRLARGTASATRPAAPRPEDREEQRREIERAERRRAHAERVRDNLAARHPLALR